MSRRLVAGTAGTALLALLLGCGGYNAAHPARAKARGRATVHVKWPTAAARLIPASAQSLVVSVAKGGTVVGTVLIVRPDASGTLTGLPYGTLAVSVKAYATADGTGVAQATGAGTMMVTEETPGTVAVAPDSTVATLTLSPNPLALARGGTATVVASALDASGAIVPLASSAGAETLAWTVAPASVASVQGTGPTATLTGLAEGDAAVAATLKVRDDGTSVTSAPLAFHVSAPITVASLPTAGYPVMGADYGGSGQGHGPAAGGSVGTAISVGSGAATAVTGPDGTVYAVSDGKLIAQTAAGVLLWSVDETGGLISGLALNASGALFVSTNKGLEGHRADTGALVWNLSTDSITLSPPVMGRDGTVYVFTPTTLYAVRPADGTLLWSHAASLVDRLAIGDDGTLYGHNGATVTAFDPATGTTRWSKVAFGADTLGTDVTVANGAVYLVTGTIKSSSTRSIDRLDERGTVMADEAEYEAETSLDENGNAMLGGRSLTGSTGKSGITTGNTGKTGITTGTTGGSKNYTYYVYRSVVALSASDGSALWHNDFPSLSVTTTSSTAPPYDILLGAPAVGNGRIVAQVYGCTVGLDTAGNRIWQNGSPIVSFLQNPIVGVSLASDGTAYVLPFESAAHAGTTVQALDSATGTVRWSASLEATPYGFPTIADDGTVYMGTLAGKVIPIR